MSDVRVEVELDNFDRVMASMDTFMPKLLDRAADETVTLAKRFLDALIYDTPPAPSGYYRTGDLYAATRRGADEGDAKVVESAIDYAIYVHEGHRVAHPKHVFYVPPKPYLKMAADAEGVDVLETAKKLAKEEGLA